MAEAARKVPGDSPDSVMTALWRRFMSWWHGHEDGGSRVSKSAQTDTRGRGGEEQSAKRKSRVDLLQEVWGRGYSRPGGDDAIFGLVDPLGLTSESYVLDLGAGLGGSTRLIARHFGANVTGYEPDPELSQAAMALSAADGLSNRAPIRNFDLLQCQDGSFDCLVSSGFLFSVHNKRSLFEAAGRFLGGKGQIHFTDFVLPARKHQSQALSDWMAKDPAQPMPWSADGYRAQLKALNFEICDEEDLSEETGKAITLAWAGFLSGLRENPPDKSAVAKILSEFETWANREKLLEEDDLRFYRIHARRLQRRKKPKPKKRKKKIQLMSNW